MFVELSHVSFAHGGGEPIFQQITQRFVPGVSAIVGQNGAGKSTLLRLIRGELRPQEGTVRLEPRAAQVLMCEQGVERLTDDIAAFAESHTREAQRWRGLLALDGERSARWQTLSPGERRRFQLAACLAQDPQVLLLDEPTNHVDVAARALIVAALKRVRCVCIIVSHDRALIDELAHTTVYIERGTLRSVQGGYSHARSVWENVRHDQLARRSAAVREVQKVERKLRDARRVQASAERGRSTRARMRNAHDGDARSIGAGTLADWAEARAGRNVAVLREQAEARRAQLSELRIEKELGRDIFAHYVPCPRPKLLSFARTELRRGTHVVLRDVQLTLGREARVRICGENGAGKSSLLEALHAATPEPERVLYLRQELSEQDARHWLDQTRALPRDQRGHVLEVLAALGVDPERVLASRQPSPGEARKLALAHGLARSAWGLFLDEPTNHLDLPSIERLEAALGAYPGALLVATHDPTFLARELAVRWTLAHGVVSIT